MPNPGAQYPANLPLPNFNAWAAVLPRPILLADKMFFIYSSNWGFAGATNLGSVLAASAVRQVGTSLTINNDAHFLAVGIFGRIGTNATPPTVFNSTGAAGSDVINPIMVFISDSSGAQWSDNDIQWDIWLGRAELPFYLPFPKLVLKNTTVTIALTNQTATAAQVQIGLLGFKVFTDWTPQYARR